MMKTATLALLVALAPHLALAADSNACHTFKWSIAREQALFASAPAAASGSTIEPGHAADLALKPIEDLAFAVPPEHAPPTGTYGGVISTTIGEAGSLQVTLSDEGWIDVIQNGHAVPSTDYTGKKGCPGIRKSVRFALSSGPATIELSGAKGADLRIAVLPSE